MEMETDSLEVVNLWNLCHSSRSLIALVLLDIEGLAASFSFFYYSSCKETCQYSRPSVCKTCLHVGGDGMLDEQSSELVDHKSAG